MSVDARRDRLIAALRRRDGAVGPPVRPEPSSAQRGLWLLDRLHPRLANHHMATVTRLRGPLDVAALGRAITAVVARHGALRSTFPAQDGLPALVVRDAAPVEVPVITAADEDHARAVLAERLAEPFDLERDLLVRPALARLAAADHVLLVVIHHIVSDDVTQDRVMRELWDDYTAFEAGREVGRTEVQVHSPDDAVRQSGGPQRRLRYWREQLAGMPDVLELPGARPRPEVGRFRGRVLEFEVSREVTAALREVGRRRGATLFMTALAAFQLLLARASGRTDVAVGVQTTGRTRPEFEDAVGFFVNLVVMRVDCTAGLSFDHLLARVRRTVLSAYDHQDVPFEHVVAALAPSRHPTRSPLAQVVFQLWEEPARRRPRPAGLVTERFPIATTTSRFDLECVVVDRGHTLSCRLVHDRDVYPEVVANRLASEYRELLASVARDPGQRLDLPAGRWVGEPGGRAVDLPGLFRTRVATAPDAPAVVVGETVLTYAQLDRRATRTAVQLGGPRSRAAVLADQPADLVVAVVAAAMAGARVMLLPVDEPRARTRERLAAADCPVLLTGAGTPGRAGIAAGLVRRTVLLDAPPAVGDAPDPVRPDEVVWMPPETVPVTHGAVVEFVRQAAELLDTPDAVLLTQRPTAAAVHGVWAALTRGARLVAPAPGTPPTDLGATVRDTGATVLPLEAGTTTLPRLLRIDGACSPGESSAVERELTAGPGVRRAVVVATTRGHTAYVVGEDPRGDRLRDHLGARLPEHDVPVEFVLLRDRGPRGPREAALCRLIADVLGTSRVGVHDGFFDLGGTSAQAAVFAARAGSELGVDIPLPLLFRAPSVARLVTLLEAEDPDVPRPGDAAYPGPLDGQAHS
ncbi:condensation domain-containing protein [Actinosynnema sp. NPDC050801]|uniref:condensation domain-containing protein n=1 Tax=unclassified Actinosynnema TaxID=2637065 RepID=UPI0034040419